MIPMKRKTLHIKALTESSRINWISPETYGGYAPKPIIQHLNGKQCRCICFWQCFEFWMWMCSSTLHFTWHCAFLFCLWNELKQYCLCSVQLCSITFIHFFVQNINSISDSFSFFHLCFSHGAIFVVSIVIIRN